MVWDGARLTPKNVYSSLYHSVVSPSLINPILLSSLVDFAKSNKSDDQDWKDIDIENDFIPVDLPNVDGSTYDFGFKKETA